MRRSLRMIRPHLRENLWYRVLGPDYIAEALSMAHEFDPEAKLYINEFGIEGGGDKTDALYALVQDLLRRTTSRTYSPLPHTPSCSIPRVVLPSSLVSIPTSSVLSGGLSRASKSILLRRTHSLMP